MSGSNLIPLNTIWAPTLYKVLNQAQAMFKDVLEIVTAIESLNPYGGHKHINNWVNHEKINLLNTSFAMGVLRKEQLILMERAK